jgi:hypothetical protein
MKQSRGDHASLDNAALTFADKPRQLFIAALLNVSTSFKIL